MTARVAYRRWRARAMGREEVAPDTGRPATAARWPRSLGDWCWWVAELAALLLLLGGAAPSVSVTLGVPGWLHVEAGDASTEHLTLWAEDWGALDVYHASRWGLDDGRTCFYVLLSYHGGIEACERVPGWLLGDVPPPLPPVHLRVEGV